MVGEEPCTCDKSKKATSASDSRVPAGPVLAVPVLAPLRPVPPLVQQRQWTLDMRGGGGECVETAAQQVDTGDDAMDDALAAESSGVDVAAAPLPPAALSDAAAAAAPLAS
eukprot:7384035-Prymnesium_polylepis.1